MLEVKRELKLASPIVKLFEIPAETKDSSPQQVYTAMIRAVDLVEHDWQTDPNARDASEKSKAFKGMQKTLYSGDGERFALYNNGIDILVSSLRVENWGRTDKTQDARIIVKFFEYDKDGKRNEIGDMEKGSDVGGIINGGHTFKALQCASQGIYQGKTTYKKTPVEKYLDDETLVRLTFFVNLDDEVRTDVAKYRNTSKEVAAFQLSHMKGNFKHLDKQLHSWMGLRNRISFKGNEIEDSKFTVEDIIHRINLFDINKYPLHGKLGKPGTIATSTYSNKRSVTIQVSNGEEKAIKYLYPLIMDMVTLEDYIRSSYDLMIAGKVKSMGITSKNVFSNNELLKKFPGCSHPAGGYESISGKKFTFEISNPYVLPVLSSFRFLINYKAPVARWIGTPTPTIATLWRDIGGNNIIGNQIDYIRNNAFTGDGNTVALTELGKNQGLWRDADTYVVFNKYYIDNKV